jgi:SOS-response transcriptional repressor LexA
VQGWVRTGRIAKPHLSRLAEMLNVSLEWLIHGDSPMKAIPARPRRFVPLLSWVDLASFAGPQEGTMFIETSALVGKGGFGLPIDGDWMQGEMPPGSVAIIDPDRTARPGDYVCACVDGRYVLRQYLREGDTVVLKAVNPVYPPILSASSAAKIVGVVARVEKDY